MQIRGSEVWTPPLPAHLPTHRRRRLSSRYFRRGVSTLQAPQAQRIYRPRRPIDPYMCGSEAVAAGGGCAEGPAGAGDTYSVGVCAVDRARIAGATFYIFEGVKFTQYNCS